MNIYAIIILVVILLEFIIDLVADALNIRSLKIRVPPDLEGIYDREAYRKSQEYTRINTRFSNITGTFQLVVLLLFWFLGGFNVLDQVVRSWGFSIAVSGVLYLGIILLAYSLLSLPFGIYSTFIIEEQFGFNKTTPQTFAMDQLKSIGLGILLGVPLILALISLFEYAGTFAWIYCWVLVTIYSLVIEFIFPTWIMPLFNKFTPIEEGELKTEIMDYAGSVKFPIKNVFVMDGSRRSTKSNAFFTGFGNNKRIALFDTFIAKHTVSVIVAVLAHEIGHYKKRHIPQGIIIGILHTGVVLFLLSIFLRSQGLYDAFFMEQESIYAGFLFFGLLYTPIELLLSIGMNKLSRKNEYEADNYAATTVKQPQVMIDALKKLSSHNLSNLTPHPFYVFMHYSHPPLLQRINAIKKHIV